MPGIASIAAAIGEGYEIVGHAAVDTGDTTLGHGLQEPDADLLLGCPVDLGDVPDQFLLERRQVCAVCQS